MELSCGGNERKLNIAAGKRNEIAGKQGNETEPIAACAVVGFL